MGTMSLKVLPVYSSKWCIVLQTDSYNKLESVLGRNMEYNTLCHISKVLAGESFDISCIEEELTAGDLVYFKYTPVVSVDVERSFSRYNVLSDNRCSLTHDNLRQLVVVYCNNAE